MRELAERLVGAKGAEFHVVCLPDFFLDHFVAAPPFEAALDAMRGVHGRGGGNLPGWKQSLAPGGNAANTAHALARLGVRAHLVARTTPLGHLYLRETIGKAGVDLSHVRQDGALSITTALEFAPDHRNVMLNDSGSVASFSPADLTENARTLISGSDAVLVANWAQMREAGTDVLLEVLSVARRGRALTYLDTGDPTTRPADAAKLLDALQSERGLDVFAMNENELRAYAGDGSPRETGAKLASRLTATVDVHTSTFAASWGPKGLAEAPAFPVKVLRATGAGDTWNAGNLLGYLLGFAPRDRLALANAVAGLYLSNPEGLPPTRAEVATYLRAIG